MVVKYKGQKLRYVKDFHGKEVLWILSPEQIEMPGMIFVGGYPNEYCIFMDTLSDDEQKKIRKQLNYGILTVNIYDFLLDPQIFKK